MTPEDTLQIEAASRRTAGVAALRHIRRIVDAEAAQEALKATWAKRFGSLFGVLAIVIVTWAAYLALR